MKKSFDSGSVFDYWLRRYEFYERKAHPPRTRRQMSINFTNKLGPKPIIPQQPSGKGLDETTCSALLAGGYTPYRPHHKVGAMSQNLSNVRDLNEYYRTQTQWWVSPSGEIVNWEQALSSLPNDIAHTQKGRERGPDNTQD
jgi:hypothetical protein